MYFSRQYDQVDIHCVLRLTVIKYSVKVAGNVLYLD